MSKLSRIAAYSALVAMAAAPTNVFAAPSDVSSGSVQISGSVPEIFSLQVRGVPGDLDLSPNVVVNNRLLAIFHLKYNIPLASLILSSNTATGLPENGGSAAPFATAMTYNTTCSSVNPAAGVGTGLTAANLAAGATDLKSAASALGGGFGIEEDCTLDASWVGTATNLPLAGRYAMTITLTMTST